MRKRLDPSMLRLKSTRTVPANVLEVQIAEGELELLLQGCFDAYSEVLDERFTSEVKQFAKSALYRYALGVLPGDVDRKRFALHEVQSLEYPEVRSSHEFFSSEDCDQGMLRSFLSHFRAHFEIDIRKAVERREGIESKDVAKEVLHALLHRAFASSMRDDLPNMDSVGCFIIQQQTEAMTPSRCLYTALSTMKSLCNDPASREQFFFLSQYTEADISRVWGAIQGELKRCLFTPEDSALYSSL